MAVDSPAPRDSRSRLADWLEVLCLAGRRHVATRGDVLRLLDRLDEEDHMVETDLETGDRLEREILDEQWAAADDAFDELEYRSRVLGRDYPFRIERSGQDWSASLAPGTDDEKTAAARSLYLFCLLASAIRDRRLAGDELSDVKREIPGIFQAIATWAAADMLGGESLSFGWPRPSGTGFRAALSEARERLGMGKELDSPPAWSKGKEKDAGIDVIAWRDFADRRPGKLVLFGQVASGGDWIEKSVKQDVDLFLSWFAERPTRHFIPAIFIPFPQHHECAGREDKPFEEVVHAEAWLRERKFGLVVDRLRIVGAAAKRAVAAGEADRGPTLRTVTDWIGTARAAAESGK